MLGKDKLNRPQQQLEQGFFFTRKRASKQQLQSLAGLLNWSTQAVRGAKFFVRRILDAMEQKHKTRLSAEFQKDVQWWLAFLTSFNGTVYYCDVGKVHVRVV